MPNIRPISDLKNYDEVLKEISVGDPLFLTQDGRGRYVIVDLYEYEKQCAVLELMSELAKGEEAAARGEFYTQEEVERKLGLR